jgi:hypothetical protein
MKSFPCEIKTVTLTAKEYHASFQIDDDLLKFRRSCERSEILNEVDRRITYELRRSVYGIDHPPKHFMRYPSTWYEAFKLRYFPKFLIEKYPIRYCNVTVSLSETYPDFKPMLNDSPAVIQMFVTEK